jgi:hypothetical protein
VESGGSSVGKVGECDIESRHFQGCRPLPVSVKDRWVCPREQVLNVPIACRRYGHNKPSSRLSIEACLFPTASLTVMGVKLGTDSRTDQPSCCGLGREPFFLRAVDLFKSVDDYVKVAIH